MRVGIMGVRVVVEEVDMVAVFQGEGVEESEYVGRLEAEGEGVRVSSMVEDGEEEGEGERDLGAS